MHETEPIGAVTRPGVADAGATGPRVWLLVGHKPGDNAQIRQLARAIGWPTIEKKIVVRPEWELAKPRIRPSLDHIDRGRSDALEGPWPDLVIASGRRLASVGLWIKRASGGRSRLVTIGMPRHRHGDFDLMVVASHYVLGPRRNVARHDLPLMAVDRPAIECAGLAWRARLADLRRPLSALFVGGPTGGLHFDLAVARRLLRESLADVGRHGGSLYVTTSRRTPPEVVRMFENERPPDVPLHVFDPNAPAGENPYLALLALADHFIVTTDSLSMMVEVARLGRSLSIFPLEGEGNAFERGLERLGVLRLLDARVDPIPAGGPLARAAYRVGLPVHSRDLSAIPRRLVELGRAGWLGEPRVDPKDEVGDEAGRIAVAVRALVTGSPASL